MKLEVFYIILLRPLLQREGYVLAFEILFRDGLRLGSLSLLLILPVFLLATTQD